MPNLCIRMSFCSWWGCKLLLALIWELSDLVFQWFFPPPCAGLPHTWQVTVQPKTKGDTSANLHSFPLCSFLPGHLSSECQPSWPPCTPISVSSPQSDYWAMRGFLLSALQPRNYFQAINRVSVGLMSFVSLFSVQIVVQCLNKRFHLFGFQILILEGLFPKELILHVWNQKFTKYQIFELSLT